MCRGAWCGLCVMVLLWCVTASPHILWVSDHHGKGCIGVPYVRVGLSVLTCVGICVNVCAYSIAPMDCVLGLSLWPSVYVLSHGPLFLASLGLSAPCEVPTMAARLVTRSRPASPWLPPEVGRPWWPCCGPHPCPWPGMDRSPLCGEVRVCV